MKHLISLFCVALMSLASLRAETIMRIEYLDGADYTAKVSAIARWEIDGENEKFRLVALDGTLLAERNLYSEIRRIVFAEEEPKNPTANESLVHSVLVYPNPATEMLRIDGVNAGETIRIFTLDGRMLVAETADNATLALDVKSLNSGVYLLQIGTEIVKFIKQ